MVSNVRVSWALAAFCLCATVLTSPAQGEEGVWGEWSECTKPCGNGTQFIVMTCEDNIGPYECNRLEGSCNLKPCNDPFENVEWGPCSVSCGNGTRYREIDINGVQKAQEIQCSLQSCDLVIGNCSADLIFVLDSSGSIGFMNWYVAKQFVVDAVRGLKVREDQTRIGVISFSTMVRTDIVLGQYTNTDEIIDKIWNIDYMAGITNTAGGLKKMHEIFLANKRDYVTQIAILLTDGKSNLLPETTIPNADAAAADGFEIFVIGVGVDIEMDEISAIATNDEFVYKVPDFEALSGVTNDIIEMTCYASMKTQCKETWAPCTESCGKTGVEACTRYCEVFEITDEWSLIRNFTESCGSIECLTPCPTTTTTEATTTTSVATTSTEATTTTTEPPDECYLCDFTKGQIWLPDRNNCHMFFVCEPIGGYLKYRKHHMTCGDLWWHQDIHSCERSPQEGCDQDGPVVTYPAPSTSEAPCPYEPVLGQVGYFRSIDSPSEIQRCVQGMVFMDPPCQCVQVGEIIPSCSDDLLLHFSYEDHYNDVTCHHAIATQYGDNVSRVYNSVRDSKVACFGGDTRFEVSFLRTWFAENNVDKFSVAVWFQRQGGLLPAAAIVNNLNCRQSAGFNLAAENSEIIASITTDSEVVLNPAVMNDNSWHHAAWVYDGQVLKLYIDGVVESQMDVEGFMQNNDVPMHIANCCGGNYFTGCIDELRVYERVLSQADIDELRTF